MLAAAVIGFYVVLVATGAYFVFFRGHRSKEFEAADRRERALSKMRTWMEIDDEE